MGAPGRPIGLAGTFRHPRVPGHEIVGRVVAVGEMVTKFTVGEITGVGCMVDSCGTCENCLNDQEQICLRGKPFTYNSPDKVSVGSTLRCYSEGVVVAERFAILIPPGMDLASTACGGACPLSARTGRPARVASMSAERWRLGGRVPTPYLTWLQRADPTRRSLGPRPVQAK